MATDLGHGVSTVYDNDGYNYDLVVFQKGKPPLDAELNLAQELQNLIGRRNLNSLPSGWITTYPFHANKSLGANYPNKFFTQVPLNAKPEYALVNGQVLYVTNTASTTDNANLIDLGTPPASGNTVNGVFLEMWRALLDPNTNLTNGVPVKPGAAVIVDTFNDMYMYDSNNGWICGTNGLILKTTDGGNSWAVMAIDTKRNLNALHYANSAIGWVVGDNGVIGRTSSGGQSWTMLTSPTVAKLNSIFAVSQTVVWTVGENGTILKATNGISFVPVSSPVTDNLNDVFFCDSMHGWIVGDNGIILVTNNGGVSWTQATSGTTNNLNAVCFYNVNFGFAVGNSGTILGSSNGGATWVIQSNNISGGTITNNLRDVTMFPKLDEIVTNEEVSSQLGSIGTSFTTMHYPITGEDGKGIVTNNPADVTVKVNGTEVTVIGVNGLTGLVVLATAPGPGAVTKIDYHYQFNCAVFQGKAWTVGDSGKVLTTSDIGATWTSQNPNLSVITDLMAITFLSQSQGWLCGGLSVIRNTQNGGVTWSIQQSDVFSRQVQRVWQEGNTLSNVYLDENTIHPDALIETTKRVQVQYRIRVIGAVDPFSYPEAGLNSNVTGRGPNASGSFGYENMGPINGDYGCWRAKCSNTVDGYCYAIPMAFVNRRNQQYYNAASNPNGQHHTGTSQIRPDLLLATNVVSADILDVRRRVIIPSVEELFSRGFDALSSNVLKTNFVRVASGQDRYGTELLQVDTVDAAAASTGLVSSESVINKVLDEEITSGTVPSSKNLTPSGTGIFHPDPSRYDATYLALSLPADGKTIPGYFSGVGTPSAFFVYNQAAKTSIDADEYQFGADFITESSQHLTFAPVDPQLVINTSEGSIYHGVLDSTSAKIIETWDSGIPGYENYALAYSAQDASDSNQLTRSSGVEVHNFIRVDSSNLSSGILSVKNTIVVDSTVVPYYAHTVKQVYNRTSGFAHKLSDMTFVSTLTKLTPVAGYEFITGTILEVISDVVADDGRPENVRNGATANFNSRLRSVNSFTWSEVATTDSGGYKTYPVGTEILGWSTTNTTSSLSQAICWDTVTGNMREAVVVQNPLALEEIQVTPTSGPAGQVRIQVLRKEILSSANIQVAYNYIPFQTQNLPATLTVEPVNSPLNLYISNLGAGGGTEGAYDLPLEHIPVDSDSITNDKRFSNFVRMQLANYFITSGFLELPVNVPGSFLGGTVTLSGPTQDSLLRQYYSTCSKELVFEGEGLQMAVPRKVYLPLVARVVGDNSTFMNGEYVLVIFSRPVMTDKENKTGYFSNGNCSISVYRFPNRPINRQ
jgi:photosystem II stability/assembly factor-like uncharacterized protein